MNTVKTAVLMAGLAGILMLLGGVVAGDQGVIIAFIIAMGLNFFSYWFSDKLVLTMYRAQEVSAVEAPELHQIVRNLADRAGLPMPRVYIIPTETPNAFATGRNPSHAVVAVTEGILKMLNRDELEGVLGHELAHVKHRDILIQTIAATFASAISFLAFMAHMFIVKPFSGGGLASLFSTHPPTEDRIARLQELAYQWKNYMQ